jgi:hypothetical protein
MFVWRAMDAGGCEVSGLLDCLNRAWGIVLDLLTEGAGVRLAGNSREADC